MLVAISGESGRFTELNYCGHLHETKEPQERKLPREKAVMINLA
jgi:hypothetical protein